MRSAKPLNEDKNEGSNGALNGRNFQSALPGVAGMVDLFSCAEQLAISRRLKELLNTGHTRFELPADASATLPLTYWQQEIQIQQKTLGHHPLFLGFPLLLYRDEEQLIAAPLFFWHLQMTALPEDPERTMLAHTPNHPVYYNHWLLANLSRTLGQDKVDPICALLEKRPMTEAALIEALREIVEAADFRELSDAPSPVAFPSAELQKELAETGAICWSGVIGTFPPIDPVDLEFPRAKLTGGAFREVDGHRFGPFDLDPDQATTFQHIREHEVTLIDGPSGSGKTHLLTHLVVNGLANGKKTLIISSRLDSLREIREQLIGMKLGSLAFYAWEEKRDIPRLFSALAEISRELELKKVQEDGEFGGLLEKWEREKQKLDEGYHALRRPVFGAYNWVDTVGLFLQNNRREGKELLTAHLNAQDFRFKFEEYSTLKEAVVKSRPLYMAINTLRHPLEELHPDIFSKYNREQARGFLQEQLEVFIQKCTRLQKSYIGKIDAYADQLTHYYESWCDGFIERAGALLNKLDNYIGKYGKDYELTSMTSLKLYGSFIPKYRAMLRAKEEVFTTYDQIVVAFKENPQFDFEFAPSAEGRMLPRMRGSLEALLQELEQWRKGVPGMVREELSRLSNKTVHPQLHFLGHIQELEEGLDLLLAELNRAGIYETALSNRMLTIQKRRKHLEGVIEQLENSRMYLRDFDRFFPWQQHWLQLSETARKVVRALIKVKPTDWGIAFDSWYLNNCLVKAYSTALPNQEIGLRQYVYNHDQLQSKLMLHILKRWNNFRIPLLRETKQKDKRTFQKLFKLKRPSEVEAFRIKDISPVEMERMLNFLPVWLMTPEMARKMPFASEVFDYVWVDEAHLVSPFQGAGILESGKRSIVSGDSQHVHLGPDYSLFNEARSIIGAGCKLRYIHRWHPGDALRLVNPLRLAHRAITGFKVRVDQVSGTYDEQNATNRKEAEQVIRLLNDIVPPAQETYPSVAIVAFTKSQRDLISELLREIKEKELAGADTVRQLEQRGMGVYYLDEMAGNHPEVLIISGTYGRIDQNNNLPNRINVLNSPEGEAQLSLLMSRALHHVLVVNSIPPIKMDEFSSDFEHRGTFLLANYIKYLYALEESDAGAQQLIVQKLRNHFPVIETERPPSPFIREVALALQSYLASERIHPNAQDAHLLLPIKIDPVADQVFPHVLLPDAYFGQMPQNDYRWEFRQREFYSELHYHLLSTWSVNWWKNAQQEAQKLASQILEYDDRERKPES